MDAPGSLIQYYQVLWRCVLSLAIKDALGIAAFQHEVPKHERERTRAWLLSNNRDFRLVCHLAGLDPDYVHDKLVRLFALPYPELSTLVETGGTEPGRNRKRRTPLRQNWRRDRPAHLYDPLNRPA
jgi:hypothetical protein